MKFLITCAARTGSTMLRYAIDSHSDLVCHGEIFTPEGIKGLSPTLANRYDSDRPMHNEMNDCFKNDKSRLLSDYIFENNYNNCNHIGFKFKTDEYFDPRYNVVRSFIQQNIDRVIHLKRQNLLDQYISHSLVLKGLKPTVHFVGEKMITNRFSRFMKFISPSKFKINKYDFDVYCQSVINRELEIEKELGSKQIYTVWYEDIISDTKHGYDKLLDFLGVSKQTLIMKTNRLVTDAESHISNYQEIMEFADSKGYNYKR